MPWKEPGEKPRDSRDPPSRDRGPRGQDPWGGPKGPGGPDLAATLRRWRRMLGPFGHGPLAWLAIVVVVIVLWFGIGGWTVIGRQQVGVVLRFGRLDAVLQPGAHLRLPSPIDRVHKVDVGEPRTLRDQTRLMTRDGQLALVDAYAKYKVDDVREFLFGNREAEDSIRNALAVAVRAAVGTHTLKELLARDGNDLDHDIGKRIEDIARAEKIGVQVTGAGIQGVDVPEDVKPAFDGIAKAHVDAKSMQATATAQAARSKAEAEARAAATEADAVRYRDAAAGAAAADVARFEQVLAQYKTAPQVTRHRLWLDTMQTVLSHSHVVVNSGSGSVIVQFPPRPAAATSTAGPAVPASAASASAASASAAPAVTSGPNVQGGGA